MAMIDEYIPSEQCPDFHAVDTISLGELYEEHWIDLTNHLGTGTHIMKNNITVSTLK